MTDWIIHNSTEPPALAPAAIIETLTTIESVFGPEPVSDVTGWDTLTHYRQVFDPDGIPYCSADGLEEWARYVATEPEGSAHQFGLKPYIHNKPQDGWYWLAGPGGPLATDAHIHPGDWRESLYRVWRNGNE